MSRYVDRLCKEVRGAHAAHIDGRTLLPRAADTIYFGGGTPSLLSAEQFRRIFEALRWEFDVDADAEITLECAPGQLSDETFDELLRQGMNRISFGVQSFVDRESAAVGRLHTAQQCEEELTRVRAAGIRDINLDLIAGLPHQTAQSWRYSLERTIASGVPHVSVYLLEVDDESRLGREMLEKGTHYGAAAVPSEDEAVEFYQQACEALRTADVHQYEISNFARPGHRSRHNLKYWQRQPYIGFGLDAHSMVPAGRDDMRFANTSDLDEYLAEGEVETPFALLKSSSEAAEADVGIVGLEGAFEESLFLGLRLNDGVALDSLREQFGDAMLRDIMPALVEGCEAGLLELSFDRVRLTARGRVASNEVFSRLLIPSAA